MNPIPPNAHLATAQGKKPRLALTPKSRSCPNLQQAQNNNMNVLLAAASQTHLQTPQPAHSMTMSNMSIKMPAPPQRHSYQQVVRSLPPNFRFEPYAPKIKSILDRALQRIAKYSVDKRQYYWLRLVEFIYQRHGVVCQPICPPVRVSANKSGAVAMDTDSVVDSKEYVSDEEDAHSQRSSNSNHSMNHPLSRSSSATQMMDTEDEDIDGDDAGSANNDRMSVDDNISSAGSAFHALKASLSPIQTSGLRPTNPNHRPRNNRTPVSLGQTSRSNSNSNLSVNASSPFTPQSTTLSLPSFSPFNSPANPPHHRRHSSANDEFRLVVPTVHRSPGCGFHGQR